MDSLPLPRNYDDNWTPRYLHYLSVCMGVALLTTNIIAFKFFQLFGVKFGAGNLMLPVCVIVGDLISEVYGYRRTRQIIWTSLACYLAYVLVTQLAVWLPPAAEWTQQAVFAQVFGQTPRLFVAGSLAYLAAELSNSWIISRMKIRDDGKYFWRRAVVSSIVAELANTAVFMSVAWAGRMPLLFLAHVVVNGTLLKIAIQTLVLPVTSALVRLLKRKEGVDHFDGRKGSEGFLP